MASREIVRYRMIMRTPRNSRGKELCWLCGQRPATDMHEMVNRNVTVGNDEARELSFEEGLCALLCRECHECAPMREVEQAIWKNIFYIYGRGDMKVGKAYSLEALQRLNDSLQYRVYANMPEV